MVISMQYEGLESQERVIYRQKSCGLILKLHRHEDTPQEAATDDQFVLTIAYLLSITVYILSFRQLAFDDTNYRACSGIFIDNTVLAIVRAVTGLIYK